MKKFDVKEFDADLNRSDVWEMVYERDTLLKKFAKAVTSAKVNNFAPFVQLLDAVIHERNEFEECSMRLVESMQGLIKENQELRRLTEHFTISTPK